VGVFQRSVPSHLIPIHADNIASKDWIILLEAGTIVGPTPERLRVARSTLERKIVRKRDVLLRPKHYLVVEGYDPRIHAVYFCPQLYKYDSEKKLVPLQGDEIGRLIANSVESGIVERRPWYQAADQFPDQPIINAPSKPEFDTLVVDMPSAKNSAVKGAK
jgi:hypothetical protein